MAIIDPNWDRVAIGKLAVVAAGVTWFGFSQAASAHEHHEHDHAEQEFTSKEQFKPTPLPDRVVLTWSDDPTTSMDVTWRTDLTSAKPRAEYARADSLLGNLKGGDIPHAKRVEGSGADHEFDLGKCRINSVQIEDLEPGTMYAYRVGDGKHWSEWFQFRTASKADEPFTFVYFGDAQNAVRSLWSRVIREANQHAPRAAFMLHAGDLINTEDADAEWGEWFGAGGWLNGMIPVVATPGNHEYHDDYGLAHHWRPQFAFPQNGPAGLEETVYWIDYQGARIISLNSNEQINKQTEWLRSVLREGDRPKWTIITFHHPIYSAAKERDNAELRHAWQPIFDEFGVDLVLQGHDHAYARSGSGGPKNVADGVRRRESHTVYVVSVSGPKQYPLHEKRDVSRVASGVQLFQVIRVSREEIKYEARLAGGELYEAFTLRKGMDGKTEMIEQVPQMSEIRVPIEDD